MLVMEGPALAVAMAADNRAASIPHNLPLTHLPGFRYLSLSSLSLLLLLVCLPPLHKVSRRTLRPFVVFHVERGLEWVVLAQRHQHRLLTTLCSISCFTVSVKFYITFLPFLIWVSPHYCRTSCKTSSSTGRD